MKNLSNITLIGIDCTDLKCLQLAADISTKEISFGSVKLLSSIESDDPRVIKIPHIESVEDYSDFIIKDLHKYIDTEFAIIFQYDGFILNPSAWSDTFLNYDYIGSPWYHLGDLKVGNGGFSLRSKKLINWLGENWKKVGVPIHPEDIFISRFARPYLEQEGMSFAPEEIAKKFSMEGNERCVVWNGEFGFHGIKYTDISNWLINHPEYKEQLNYKLDDYGTIMKKYPVYDGTIHTFKFKKWDIKNYIEIADGQKKYEARITKGKHHNYSNIKIGDMIIFRRSGMSLKEVPVPSFEKKIIKIENFKSLTQLQKTYPKIIVSPPLKDIQKWKRPFIKIFGSFVYPRNESYTIFWFD